MLVLPVIITFSYLILIGSLIIGFNKVPTQHFKNYKPKTKFSIIIPFRNESNNLPMLLESIKNLKYPSTLFEVILIDDNSQDDSTVIIEKKIKADALNNIRIVNNQRATNSPKKDAISTAINISTFDWIITTDADCLLPEYWLNCFNDFITTHNNVSCIAAPVTYIQNKSFLENFQLLDFLSLQGATIGGFGINKPFLCNGANFAYKKSLFKKLNGFEGNTNIAGGDDIFFLEKVNLNYPKQLYYLKDELATVKTRSLKTWKDLISQRLRWAAKASAFKNTFSKTTGIIVFFTNSLIIALLILSLLCYTKTLYILIGILGIKFYLDLTLIYKAANFFNQHKNLQFFFSAFVIYPFFSVYIVLMSSFKTFKWKERTFKR